jgi:hypothetical protein
MKQDYLPLARPVRAWLSRRVLAGVAAGARAAWRTSAILALSALWANPLGAQLPGACPEDTPVLSNNCAGACVLCGVETFVSNNNTFLNGAQLPPGFCPGDPVLPQNLQWVGFVAGEPEMTLLVTPSNCLLPGNNGLQMGVWSSMDCNDFTLVSNCVFQAPPNQVSALAMDGLTVGGTYFLVVDGFQGDVCDFEVAIIGATTAPPVTANPQIIPGEQPPYCAGEPFPFSTPSVPNAGQYTWRLNGAVIGYGQEVEVVFPGNGSYQLCVEASNACHPAGTQNCTVVTIAPSMQSVFETVCTEDLPFFYEGFFFNISGVYDIPVVQPNGCTQLVRLHLTVIPPPPPTFVDAWICQGETYSFGNLALTQTGIYTQTFPSAATGCDSTVTLFLTVHPPSFTFLGNITHCSLDGPFTLFGIPIQQSGPFSMVFPSYLGCDSTVIGNLTLLAPDTLSLSEEICAGSFYVFEGDTLNTAGVYYSAPSNCDDTLFMLSLELLSSPDTLLDISICAGENYVLGDSVYTASGTYEQIYPAANGCDSTITLQLSVLQPQDTVQAAICPGESYTLGGMSFSTAGAYDLTLTSSTGCQSQVHLILEVLDAPEVVLSAEICSGQSYAVGGSLYAQTGQYVDTLAAANGCDSIVHLELEVLPVDTIVLQASFCADGAYDWDGELLDQPGQYFRNLTSSAGCDSILQLTLEALPADTVALQASICEGEVYDWDGELLGQAGQYTRTLLNSAGCDSLLVLNLMVWPTYEIDWSVSICEGEGFVIGGDTLVPGTYQYFLTSVNGCDSIVNLELAVLPVYEEFLSVEICEGEVFELGGLEFDEAGLYELPFATSAGCDSTIWLTLEVVPEVMVVLDTTLCPGERLQVGPYDFGEPTQFLLEFTGANGCDSIVQLNLAYYDTIAIDSVQIVPDRGTLLGGSITVELTGGTGPYTYFWSNGQDTPFADFLSAGQYSLLVVDAAGCFQTFYFTVPFNPGPTLPGTVIRDLGGGLRPTPNPFTNELRLSWAAELPEAPVQLSFYNLLGQPVWEQVFDAAPEYTLRPALPAGIYWLVARQAGQVVGVERVVRQ